jgi:hypothetical protein
MSLNAAAGLHVLHACTYTASVNTGMVHRSICSMRAAALACRRPQHRTRSMAAGGCCIRASLARRRPSSAPSLVRMPSASSRCRADVKWAVHHAWSCLAGLADVCMTSQFFQRGEAVWAKCMLLTGHHTSKRRLAHDQQCRGVWYEGCAAGEAEACSTSPTLCAMTRLLQLSSDGISW